MRADCEVQHGLPDESGLRAELRRTRFGALVSLTVETLAMFTQHADYTVPLLRLLADLPGGAGTTRGSIERISSALPR